VTNVIYGYRKQNTFLTSKQVNYQFIDMATGFVTSVLCGYRKQNTFLTSKQVNYQLADMATGFINRPLVMYHDNCVIQFVCMGWKDLYMH
jgi:hypothetical protein